MVAFANPQSNEPDREQFEEMFNALRHKGIRLVNALARQVCEKFNDNNWQAFFPGEFNPDREGHKWEHKFRTGNIDFVGVEGLSDFGMFGMPNHCSPGHAVLTWCDNDVAYEKDIDDGDCFTPPYSISVEFLTLTELRSLVEWLSDLLDDSEPEDDGDIELGEFEGDEL